MIQRQYWRGLSLQGQGGPLRGPLARRQRRALPLGRPARRTPGHTLGHTDQRSPVSPATVSSVATLFTACGYLKRGYFTFGDDTPSPSARIAGSGRADLRMAVAMRRLVSNCICLNRVRHEICSARREEANTRTVATSSLRRSPSFSHHISQFSCDNSRHSSEAGATR